MCVTLAGFGIQLDTLDGVRRYCLTCWEALSLEAERERPEDVETPLGEQMDDMS
jgi:hypothetical protein